MFVFKIHFGFVSATIGAEIWNSNSLENNEIRKLEQKYFLRRDESTKIHFSFTIQRKAIDKAYIESLFFLSANKSNAI